jgi:putative flippase GtrA
VTTATAAPGDPGASVRVHRFAILSGIGWLLDFGTFNALALVGIDLFVANLVGATVGVTWVFVTARRFIFRSRRTSLQSAIAGYALWNLCGILLASWAVEALGRWLAGPAALPRLAELAGSVPFGLDPRLLAAPLAKVAVTPFTMYLNFVMMGVITERKLHFR